MIFLFLIPSVPATLGNFLIPIMIGARDLAFPKLNLFSWYLLVAGGIFTLTSLVLGGVDTGWTFTTPLSTHYLNTHVVTTATGIFIAGFSSIFTGLNFIVTVHRNARAGNDMVSLPLLRLVSTLPHPSSWCWQRLSSPFRLRWWYLRGQ